MASEIAPQSCRTLISSCSTAVNWLSNFIVGYITPILQDKIHYKFYILPLFFCVISYLVVKYYYPETNGLHLEDMASVFYDEATSVRSSSLTSNSHSIKRYNSIPSQLDGLQYQASIISTPSGRFDTSLNNKGNINVTKPLANKTLQSNNPMRDVLLQDDNIEGSDHSQVTPTTNLLTGQQLSVPTIDEFVSSKYSGQLVLRNKG